MYYSKLYNRDDYLNKIEGMRILYRLGKWCY